MVLARWLHIAPVCDRISNPFIDGGFMPARTVNAYPDLSRECAVCNLAINCRAREAGAGQYGFQAEDTFRVWHEIFFQSFVMASPSMEHISNIL